ncbi:MAG: glycine zipper family protein [Desulfobacterales bacterium]
MKKLILTTVLLVFFAAGCTGTGYYNTQKGAVMGSGMGALAGQVIGRDTESTLIGAGIGGLMGTVIGNSMDQQAQQYRDYQVRDQLARQPYENYRSRGPYDPQYYRYNHYHRSPPGYWATVPGHWRGNVWVPAHKEWRPHRGY